ncbi:MAG: hypothetical protein IJB31_09155 [Akkermansia sp.]|nr:hypothetical protein [Akkermansia sp.]
MVSIKLSENNGQAPEAVPYMPAGLNHICCTVNGRAAKRTVMVDAATCERLNADLQEKLQASKGGEKARPVVLFDHRPGAAAAVPTGFEWDDKRGILLRVEWTQAGREAVEGGNYGYISPAFVFERGSALTAWVSRNDSVRCWVASWPTRFSASRRRRKRKSCKRADGASSLSRCRMARVASPRIASGIKMRLDKAKKTR